MIVAKEFIVDQREKIACLNKENKMKKAVLLLIVMFVLVFSAFALNKDDIEEEKIGKKFAKGSMYVTGQIGINSYVATDDPFNAIPFLLGASYEVALTDNIGIGGTVMFDKWSDYLGMFGGKWTFRVFKPSFDITYHFYANKMKGLNLFTGASFGYSILSVSNELGNDYVGELKSEPHFALFLGLHLYFWENLPGFFNNLFVTSKVYWSVAGDFSGVSGTIGITYKIK
jgi:hypothetical protein